MNDKQEMINNFVEKMMNNKEEMINNFIFDKSVLAVIALLACLACIWMVFFFGRRLQTSAYLRDSLVEGVKQQEFQHLLRDLIDQATAGPLDKSKPPPDGFGPVAQLWRREGEYLSYHNLAWGYEDETKSEKDERLQKYAECKAWAAEEQIRFESLRKEAEETALERAEKKVPRSIDISLLGGGWAFLLEFSTVIVIIFTLLIFGILGTLQGKDISTILAAIAGYVLGKATAGTKQSEQTSSAKKEGTSSAL